MMPNDESGGSKGEELPSSTQSEKNAPDSGEIEIPQTKGISAVAVLWTFGKCLGALLPVYLAGYYRVSTSLLVFGMMVYTGWKHAREAKEARMRSAMQLHHNDQEYTSTKMFTSKRDLPAWVNFPDVEKVEWLNKVLQQVWPFVGQYLEKLLTETIAPSIRASSGHLQTLTFTKVDFGNKAMKVVGIKAHTENDKGQVLLDLYISYVGNVEINVEVKRYFCKAGINGIQLHGMMRVILEPLIGDVPIVGAVTMFFIRRPKLDINWTGLTNLLDIPGLNVMSDSMIMDAIAAFLVLPNRLTVPLVADLHVAQLRSPLPRGVVRIHLLEAADLAAKDNFMAGMSDPYAVLRVGPQTFTSHHEDNTLSPKWGEMYEVIVHEVPGQEMEVEVYDKDTDQDDFLGRAKIDLGIVKKSIVVDDWFTLKDTPSGRVHFKLEWLSLLPNTDRLEQILRRNESVTTKTTDPPSSAILVVYLDKAEALPMKKGNKDPNPMVQLSVQDITRESKTCYTTINPNWEEAFTFFIPDPRKQDIDIQVKDVDRVQTLGSLSIQLSRVLSSPGLTLDQWFQLDNSGPASRIYIKTVLRVLWLDEEKISAAVSSNLEAQLSKQLPQQSSPHHTFATEGLLRIHLLEGQNLIPKDNMMGGLVKGKSDPYVNINIGGETFTSRVIKGNLNPTWNEMYEVVLTQLPGQDLHVEMFDKDMDMKDDFMGRLKINLKEIIDAQYTDQWYTLSDVKSGRVHLVLDWVPTASEPDRLDQVLQFHSRKSYQNKTIPSVGLLFVYVERADSLPLKKSGKEPKVGVELIIGRASHKTTVCDRTTSPKWNEAFYFPVRDPREEMLIVKLSHSWALAIGSVVVPVRELLTEPQLVLDQWLNLDGASPESRILLRAELKMLIPTKCPGAVDMPKPRAAPEPPIAPPKLETDKVQRSSSVDTPIVDTPIVDTPIVDTSIDKTTDAPVSVPDNVKAEETAAEVVQEEMKEAPSPPIVRPPHTSPDLSFGSEGLLRIHLLEAQGLVAKDNLMGGMVKGKSDPYAKINIGEVTFKSHVIKGNLNPIWNEMYEVVLSPRSRQEVLVELYDKDMDRDDFLGRFKVSLADIIHSQYTDQWHTLNDVKSGRVHLVLEWLPTVSEKDTLDKVLQLQSLQSYQDKAVPSAALLFVYVERAHSLPLKKSGKEPKAGAELVLGDTRHRTKVCDRTSSPQWDEAFYFLVRDPREEMLIVKLSSAWDQPMGSVVVPVRELLTEPQLVLDQWLHLDGASPESQILLRAELKILNTKMTEALQGSATGPKEDDPVIVTEQLVTPAYEEKRHSTEQLVTLANEEKQLSTEQLVMPANEEKQHSTEQLVTPVNEEKQHSTEQLVMPANEEKQHSTEQLVTPVNEEKQHSTEQLVMPANEEKQHSTEQLVTPVNEEKQHSTEQLVTLANEEKQHSTEQLVTPVNEEKQHSTEQLVTPVNEEKQHSTEQLVMPANEEKQHSTEQLVMPSYEEKQHSTEQLVTPANEEQQHSKLSSDEWGAAPSQPEEPVEVERVAVPTVEDPTDEPVVTHTAPDPSPVAQLVEEPAEVEEAEPESTPQSVTEAREEPPHWQVPTEGTRVENLAQATVTGFPSELVPEQAEIKEDHGLAEALPPHTTAGRDFGSEGVLRIHLLEAQNLIAKDNLMGGMVKGKSDPYVKISIEEFKFKSLVIKGNLNPTWNEMYEVVLNGHASQEIQFEAFDKDLDSDDFLGRFSIRLSDVIRSHYTDQWYTLKDVKSGRVHLILEWVPTVSESVRLDQVLQLQSLQSYQNKAVPSAALLFVYVERAHSLPLKKSGKEPKAGAELVLGETTYRTKVCDRSIFPEWNESFYFVVRDPKHEMLVVKLSSGWDQPMGSVVVPVRELLTEPQLVLDQWLHLDGASPESQILLRAELKILDSKMVDLIEAGTLPCAASGGSFGNGQVKLSLNYASKERRLVVTVHACRGLLSSSKDGVDSYVSLMLLPDKSKATKRKTGVKKREINPEYNERFEYDLSLEDTRFKRLSVSVKNNSASFRSKDVIGQVLLELAQIDLVSGVTEWFDLKDEDE